MSERRTRATSSDRDGSGERRVVQLRPSSRPSPACGDHGPQGHPAREADPDDDLGGLPGDEVAPWAGSVTSLGAGDGAPWGEPRPPSGGALAESVFPFGTELPFEPDPEAAAFLNAPRRPLSFYVAPFGTPPFGPGPGGPASTAGPGAASTRLRATPDWGPAYPAGA